MTDRPSYEELVGAWLERRQAEGVVFCSEEGKDDTICTRPEGHQPENHHYDALSKRNWRTR